MKIRYFINFLTVFVVVGYLFMVSLSARLEPLGEHWEQYQGGGARFAGKYDDHSTNED